jgi:hypothetical protein
VIGIAFLCWGQSILVESRGAIGQAVFSFRVYGWGWAVKKTIPASTVVLVGLMLLLRFTDLFGLGDFFEPKTETEKYLDRLLAAVDGVSDAMAEVKDAASACPALSNISSKVDALTMVLYELHSIEERYKDEKVSKARKDRIVERIQTASQRFQGELERIAKMPDLPASFAESMDKKFIYLEAAPIPGSSATILRDMALRQPGPGKFSQLANSFRPAGNPISRPPVPPENPALRGVREIQEQQQQERVRQRQEAERRASEDRERLQKQQQEEMARLEIERKKEEAGPDPSDPEYFEKLADRLESNDWNKRDKAIKALLKKKPDDVPSRETRKQIAQAFKSLAEEPSSFGQQKELAIRGLVIWGGKHSGPILLKILKASYGSEQNQVMQALGEIHYGPAAEAIAARLGNAMCHEYAARALLEIGPEAEPVVIEAAASEIPAVCLTAVQLLGEWGTAKCIPVLSQGYSSRNMTVRTACRDALRKVRARMKEAKEKGNSGET